MSEIRVAVIQRYLTRIMGSEVTITGIMALGEAKEIAKPLKEYGYGTPLRIDLTVGGSCRSLVFNTIKPGGFGHDRMPDRAAILLWQAKAFNMLPKHARAIDVGALTMGGSAKTLGDCTELFLLTEHVEGNEYYHDLDRIRNEGNLTPLDLQRCEALAKYIAAIHALKHEDAGLYERRIRELIGHNECILGLIDSYPPDLPYIGPLQFADIEKHCIDWRWKIKRHVHRLRQVHGDFHPWNILFRKGTDFTVLDRSRGEWGEPADDLTAMTINYLFYALQQRGTLDGPFKTLWDTFHKTYMEKTRDHEIFQVIQPFLCWRALVIASPVWYPHLSLEVRAKLLNLARNILKVQTFNPDKVNPLLEAPT
jgi:hypothetical protein